MQYLIVGANSEIAKAIIYELAEGKLADSFILLARDQNELERSAQDLRLRFSVTVSTHAVELGQMSLKNIENFYYSLNIKPDAMLYSIGYMGDRLNLGFNANELEAVINLNYSDAVAFMELVSKEFEEKKSGLIMGISSVAGMRGRQSNYIYGSAKAAFIAYLSGLRNRLFSKNIHVMTVLPGFVNTKMTREMKLPALLTVEPEDLAKKIVKAIRNKKDVVYSNFVWFCIMLIIRLLPESIFKRLKL